MCQCGHIPPPPPPLYPEFPVQYRCVQIRCQAWQIILESLISMRAECRLDIHAEWANHIIESLISMRAECRRDIHAEWANHIIESLIWMRAEYRRDTETGWESCVCVCADSLVRVGADTARELVRIMLLRGGDQQRLWSAGMEISTRPLANGE